MFKLIKQLTSLAGVVAMLFAFTTESMAAKKSKTLENNRHYYWLKRLHKRFFEKPASENHDTVIRFTWLKILLGNDSHCKSRILARNGRQVR